MRKPSGKKVFRFWDSLKKYRFNSILIRNFILITVLEILVVSILSEAYAQKMEDNLNYEIGQSSVSELRRGAEILDTVIDQMYNFAYHMSVNNETQLFYMLVGSDEDIEIINGISERIKTYCNTFEYVDSVYIYAQGRDTIISSGKQSLSAMTDREWLGLYDNWDGDGYLLTARCKDGNYPFLLSMLYPVSNAKGKKVGAIVINVELESLNKAMGRSYKDAQSIYMLNEFGKICYSNVSKTVKYPELTPDNLKSIWENNDKEKETFEVIEENGKDIVVSALVSGRGKWTYVLYTPIEVYGERVALTRRYINQNTILAIVSGLLLSYVLAMQSYRPIQRIMSDIEAADGRDEFISEENRENELRYISRMILSNKREKAKLKLQADEWMERLGHAQLLALQSQINPHFLYNTLDTINWMIMERVGENNDISEAVRSLAQLLRISLKRDSYLVSLEEELEHAKLYMSLIHVRYPGKLTVSWEIDQELYSLHVVRLCLQPILENAVRHGLRKRRYKGNVCVKGEVVDGMLIIRIEDDGVGMSYEECQNINRILNTEYQQSGNHVGIENVNQRIKILFGEAYGIGLRPREEGGLTVNLRFPVRKE